MKILLTVYLASMAMMHIFILICFSDFTFKGYNDFAAFYTAGTIVKEGQTRKLYDPALQWKVQQQFAAVTQIKKVFLPYIHPPMEAWLFLPFAYLSFAKAYVLWVILQGILLALSIWLLLSQDKRGVANAAFVAFLSVGLFPIAMAFLQGQDSILLFFIFSSSFFWLIRQQVFRSGMVLALGLIKFQLILPIVLIFVMRRQWKFVAGFVATSFCVLLSSSAMIGWDGMIAYPRYLWALEHSEGLRITAWQNMPNLRSIFTWALGNPSFRGALPSCVLFVAIISAIFTSYLWKQNPGNRFYDAAGFSLAIVISMLTSYYLYSYELTLLLIPLLIVGKAIIALHQFAGWPRRLFMMGTALLFFSPIGWFLILRTQQFFWYGCLVLLFFSVSLAWSLHRAQKCVVPNTI